MCIRDSGPHMHACAARGLQMQVTCNARVACARVRVVRDLPRQATDRTCTRVLHVTCRCKPHAERPLAWVVWLGTRQRFIADGAKKSMRGVTPTCPCVCVGVGVGHAHLPCLAQGSGRMGDAKASALHAILSLFPIWADQWSPGGAVTIGQPSYPFGPNHELVLPKAHGQGTGS